MNDCVQAASRMYFNSQFFPGMGGMGGMMGSIKAAGGMMGGMKGGIPGFMSGLDSMGAMAGRESLLLKSKYLIANLHKYVKFMLIDN